MNGRIANIQKPLRELVAEHRKSFDPHNPRDYVDHYFCAQESRINEKGDVGTFTDDQLIRNLSDLYVAGFETTTTFLRWAMVYMIFNPEVQTKVQAEVDWAVVSSRWSAVADQSKMPHSTAVINEVTRITYFVPFGVPHCTTEDVPFKGYTIPKGIHAG
ncbi:hypothetical protein RvY_18766-2 [Ramazzottius varieornatus]|uniref:Cytochrome P450 n=1 Tax=Ramazzottius varieornatus TaxID=947166 RepID=A0A1D1W6Y5_RAMVA|nr:hypothetical protein RvY_18766-2 [Ramazzottius varieornatus]